MRILTITGLFPNSSNPLLGTFMLDRVKAIAMAGHEVRVIAPVRYVPPGPLPQRYRSLRFVPHRERIDGLDVEHPRFLAIPRAGRTHDQAYARGIRRTLRRMVLHWKPDILDVNYLFPDACGVSRVARDLSLPFVCTARGSDVKWRGVQGSHSTCARGGCRGSCCLGRPGSRDGRLWTLLRRHTRHQERSRYECLPSHQAICCPALPWAPPESTHSSLRGPSCEGASTGAARACPRSP